MKYKHFARYFPFVRGIHLLRMVLIPNRRQAIFWSNDSLIYWRIYVSLGLNDILSRSTGFQWQRCPISKRLCPLSVKVYKIGYSAACSTVCLGWWQRWYESSASLALLRGFHQWPLDSPHRASKTEIPSMLMYSGDPYVYELSESCKLSKRATYGEMHSEYLKTMASDPWPVYQNDWH